MAELPAMPLWIDRYMLDCGHLTDAEHGRYLQILMALWVAPGQRLPNDDDWLARRFRRSVEAVRSELRPIISEFCKLDGNWITQKGLTREYATVVAKRQKQSVRAKSRWNKENDTSHGNASTGIATSGSAVAMPPTPTPTPTAISASSLPPSEFDRVDAALRAIPGVQDHPVYADPVIAPILNLVAQGFDVKTQIVPSIKSQLAKRPKGRLVKGWSYFVPGILDSVNGAAPTPQTVSDEKWQSRLDTARRKRQWDERNWGPIPGQPHCRVPQHLLRADDGQGWIIWQPEVAA